MLILPVAKAKHCKLKVIKPFPSLFSLYAQIIQPKALIKFHPNDKPNQATTKTSNQILPQ